MKKTVNNEKKDKNIKRKININFKEKFKFKPIKKKDNKK